MHKPTETFPKHAICASQPLYFHFAREVYYFDSKRQLDLSIPIVHTSGALFDFSFVGAAVCAAPNVLACFADAA